MTAPLSGLEALPVHSAMLAITGKIADLRCRDRAMNPSRSQWEITHCFWDGYLEEEQRPHERLGYGGPLPGQSTKTTIQRAEHIVSRWTLPPDPDQAMRELGRLTVIYIATVPRVVVLSSDFGITAPDDTSLGTERELIAYLSEFFSAMSLYVFDPFRESSDRVESGCG